MAAVGLAAVGTLAFATPAQATHIVPLIPHTKCGFPQIPREAGAGVLTVPGGVFRGVAVYGFITRKAFQAAELTLRLTQRNLNARLLIDGLFYRQTGDGWFLAGLGRARLGGEQFTGFAEVAFDHDGQACDANALYVTLWATSTQGGLPFPVVLKVDFDDPVDV